MDAPTVKRLAVMLGVFAVLPVLPSGAGSLAGPITPVERCRSEGSSLGACLLRPRLPLAAPIREVRTTAPGPLDCTLQGADDRCEAWASSYDHPAGGGFGIDQVTAIAAGRTGVFVTGGSWDEATQSYDVVTAAYEQGTGASRWVARFHHDGVLDAGYSVATDPDEGTVFVAGVCGADELGHGDVALLAHDAATGAQRWARCVQDEELGVGSMGASLALAEDRLYVVGHLGTSLTVMAVDVRSGDVIWREAYAGSSGVAEAFDVAVSPDGSLVYATGITKGSRSSRDWNFLTVAFRAVVSEPSERLGEPIWAATYDGATAEADDEAFSIAVTPDGTRVLVTGASQRSAASASDPPRYAATTIAYDAATGEQRWLARHEPQPVGGGAQTLAFSLAMDPRGALVYISGMAPGTTTRDIGFFTAAYDVTDGSLRWASPFQPPASTYGIGSSVAVSADGGSVVTAGPSFEGYFTYQGAMATVAHDASTGTQRWAARFTRVGDDVADLFPYPAFVATAGTRAFVGATYLNYYPDEGGLPSSFADYWTMAYDL